MQTGFELVSADWSTRVRCEVPEGDLLIGRGAAADLRLDAPEVSQLHARVRRRGDVVEVEDLGSSNGTVLNEAPVAAGAVMRPGDQLRIGRVRLRLEGSPGGNGRAGPGVTFDVNRQSGGQIHNVAGDVIHSSTVVGMDEPWDELFQGAGTGRLLMLIGVLAAVVGFGLWVAFIFTGFTGPPAGVDPFEWDPFTGSTRILGVPQPILGFALFAGGGLLSALGSGLSRAARRRRGDAVRPIRHRPGRG